MVQHECKPLIVSVTTAGSDQSYIWLEEYKYAKGVALQKIEDESFFSYCFQMDEDDDPLDSEGWLKANPNLGVSVKADYLETQAKYARESALALNRFDRYHSNRLVGSTERAFSIEDWDKCKGEMSDWSTADSIGAGVDLGGRDDLAAFGLVAKFRMDDDEDGTPVYRYEVRNTVVSSDRK